MECGPVDEQLFALVVHGIVIVVVFGAREVIRL